MRGSSFSVCRVRVYGIGCGLLLATGVFGIADVRADGGVATEELSAPKSGNPVRDIADALSSIGIPSMVLGHELLCEYQPARFIAKAQPNIGRMTDLHPFLDRNAPGVECGCKVIATGCTWPRVRHCGPSPAARHPSSSRCTASHRCIRPDTQRAWLGVVIGHLVD